MDHLIGLHAKLSADVQKALNVTWEEAMIIAVVTANNRGVCVHLLGEDGTITPAVSLEHVAFPNMTQMQLRTWMESR
jgi:hypothetical protein